MKNIKPIDIKDAKKLTPAEMNAIHFAAGASSDSISKT